MITLARSAKMLGFVSLTALVAAGVGCSGSSTPSVDDIGEAPAAAPAKAHKGKKVGEGKPKSDALRVGPKRFGGLTSSVAPTPAAVATAMGPLYTARPAEGALEGVTVQILRDGAVVGDVWPGADNASILRVYSTSDKVTYPFNGKVGMPMGTHKNWSNMSCDPAPAPLKGAYCHATSDAHMGYILEGWAGDAAVVPSKEVLAPLQIVGLLWVPATPAEEAASAVLPIRVKAPAEQ